MRAERWRFLCIGPNRLIWVICCWAARYTSPNKTGNKIVGDIFRKYRNHGARHGP